MTVNKIFCNVPWKEVHINADGTYHTCGAQPSHQRIPISKPFDLNHNVHSMTIPEWINSEYQQQARLNKLNGTYEPRCSMCHNEEEVGSSSKRIKENLKSKIDNNNFVETYNISPDKIYFDYSKDNKGMSNILKPESYHISLGNECNYACKMCVPWASSRLAVEGIANGTYFGPARQNWTEDESAWNQVTDYICDTDNLKFVHLIGGEPLLNPKFENLIDKLLVAGKTDIYLGFTTNGSIVDTALIEKLNAFRHVDIGVSIEGTGLLNDYIRKGTNTKEVLDNIDVYLKYRKEAHVYVTIRPVPSALSVHTLDDLYKWCIERRLDVMTNILVRPEHLQIKHLPIDVKFKLLEKYQQWEYSIPIPGTSDPRDPNRFREHIDSEIRAVINLLKQNGDPEQTKKLYSTIEQWGWLAVPDLKKYFVLEQV
jgi:MoaA/NifB/PqqE/SkfB family radical SAM enzyme